MASFPVSPKPQKFYKNFPAKFLFTNSFATHTYKSQFRQVPDIDDRMSVVSSKNHQRNITSNIGQHRASMNRSLNLKHAIQKDSLNKDLKGLGLGNFRVKLKLTGSKVPNAIIQKSR